MARLTNTYVRVNCGNLVIVCRIAAADEDAALDYAENVLRVASKGRCALGGVVEPRTTAVDFDTLIDVLEAGME
jgi:hypothetical protein